MSPVGVFPTLYEEFLDRAPFEVTAAEVAMISSMDHTKDCETNNEPTDSMTGNSCTCGYWELAERIWGTPKVAMTRQEQFRDEWPWLYKYHRGLRMYPPFAHEARP